MGAPLLYEEGQSSSNGAIAMFIFWCILENGNHNSVTADNLFDAQRRARALQAKKLFVKNTANGKTSELGF